MIHLTICEYETEGRKIERGELTSSAPRVIDQYKARTILSGPDVFHKVEAFLISGIS